MISLLLAVEAFRQRAIVRCMFWVRDVVVFAWYFAIHVLDLE